MCERIPVRTEEDIFREAKAKVWPEWWWRGDILGACVDAHARLFARGTDAAPIIAEAALEHCDPHANLAVVVEIWNARPPLEFTMDDIYADKEFDWWKVGAVEQLRNRAIREILKARAGGCYDELVADSRDSHPVDTMPLPLLCAGKKS